LFGPIVTGNTHGPSIFRVKAESEELAIEIVKNSPKIDIDSESAD